MNSNDLTDKEYWGKYWENYTISNKPDIIFLDLLKYLPKSGRLIELGGFPGKYSFSLNMINNYEITLIDEYIDYKIIYTFAKIYKIKKNKINIINADFMKYDSLEKYDVVCSFGLLEHYVNIDLVMKKHLEYLDSGGTLFITVPNLKGICGYFLRKYDNDNYVKHNLDAMRLEYFKKICINNHLKNILIFYYGDLHIWFDNTAIINNYLKKTLLLIFNKFLSKILKTFRICNSYTANMIVIIANK